MAPELINRCPYQSNVIDLFAAGVILFNMMTNQRPFTTAEQGDPYYRYLIQGRADQFWLLHEKNIDVSLSADFKELIQCMLHVNPQNRPCMTDIIGHPWMQQEAATEEEVKKEFSRRREVNT